MRIRAIIHLDRFLANFQAVRGRIGDGRRICVPVKADGYGHGAQEIAETSLKAGAFCLGVAAVNEGTELRKGGIKAPILLMSQSHPQEIPEIIASNLIPFVSDAQFAASLNEQALAAKLRLPVHLKIDTGMGRIGCSAEDALSLTRCVTECAGLELAGTATHFAVSDSTAAKDIEYTKAQTESFLEAVNAIKAAGIDPGIIHAANSGAVVLHPDSWFDMVRPGIFLYGYKPAEESGIPGFQYPPIHARPVMELESAVILIKKCKKGQAVSYGLTWTAEQDTNIAIIPAGYADGLPRTASGKWQALINGREYPIIGRICMDQCCIDLGPQTDVQRWDKAVIFGGSAKDAAALAEAAGTIPYEITCNINKRVPRVYLKT